MSRKQIENLLGNPPKKPSYRAKPKKPSPKTVVGDSLEVLSDNVMISLEDLIKLVKEKHGLDPHEVMIDYTEGWEGDYINFAPVQEVREPTEEQLQAYERKMESWKSWKKGHDRRLKEYREAKAEYERKLAVIKEALERVQGS